MARWQYTIDIADIHEAFQADNLTVREMGKAVAERIRSSRAWNFEQPSLRDIADSFDEISSDDAGEYDDCLERLYDWGDRRHTCWINTMKCLSNNRQSV